MSVELHIDGSLGEGGGQILRSSLTLSMATGRSFRIDRIRAGREKPGLLRQHLAAVEAAAAVCEARVEGASLGSTSLSFTPGRVRGGARRVSIGSAGSACLVLQTLIPALCGADEPSELLIEGGTHNPHAPTFDFLSSVYAPTLARMGMPVELKLERHGFYPAGGGRIRARVEPSTALVPLHMMERAPLTSRRAVVLLAHLPTGIAKRELTVLQRRLPWDPACFEIVHCEDSAGPGNVVTVEVTHGECVEQFTSFGERDRAAEAVAEAAAQDARAFLVSDVPVGRHLADQLLVAMALVGRGSYRTLAPSRHTTTNVEIVRRFLDVSVRLTPEAGRTVTVEIDRSTPN